MNDLETFLAFVGICAVYLGPPLFALVLFTVIGVIIVRDACCRRERPPAPP